LSNTQSEFARGWRVLTAAFIGIGVSLVSLPFYSAGIWIRPWQEDFGWTRTEISLATTIGILVMIIVAPLAGIIIDRFGLRKVATISLALYSLGLLAISQMNGELWVLYTISAAYTVAGIASTPLAFTRAVNVWFVKNRGLALGICLTSTGVAGVLLSRFLTPYVDEHGWRQGYMILFYSVIIALPLVWWWTPDQPPSGNPIADDDTDDDPAKGHVTAPGSSVSEALRSRAFWSIGAMFILVAIAVSGLIPSFIPLLQDAGMSPEAAGGYGAVIGGSVMIGRLVTGFLIDRIFAPYVTAVVFSLVALGCLSLGLGGIDYALVAGIALGLAIGAEVDLIGYFSARYFGLKNYGVIFGMQYSVFIVGSGISPILAGQIWDRTGNYDIALIGASVLLMAAVMISLTLPKFPPDTVISSH
jgi:predicted MFS family arabinose efflux permease